MEQAIHLLILYRYLILLPIAIIEGPIITILAGSLAALGYMNVYAVYIIAVLGNLIGDTIYYWIGRFGRHNFVPKYGRYLGITEEGIKYAEEHYKNHLGKTLFFGKITEAPIVAILVMAGATKVAFKKFFSAVTFIEVPKMLVLTLVGFYFGKYYIIIKHYLDTSTAIVFVAVIIVALWYWFFGRKKTI